MTNKIEKYLKLFAKTSGVELPKANTKFSEAKKDVKNAIVEAYFESINVKPTKQLEDEFRDKHKSKQIGNLIKTIMENGFAIMSNSLLESAKGKIEGIAEADKFLDSLVEIIKDKILDECSFDNVETEEFMFEVLFAALKEIKICPAEFLIGAHYIEQYPYAKEFDAKHLLEFARFQGFISEEPLFDFGEEEEVTA